MMFPIDYNGDVLNHNARVGVDGGIVESTDFLADFSEQTKRINYNSLFDQNTQSFITAASITDFIQQSAIDTLVKDLKKYNLWSKMKAIYPFVGGTANTHKFNLKDPRDLDAANRLGYISGTWTHSSLGIASTEARADTYLLGTTISNTSTHISFYSQTNTVNSSIDVYSSDRFYLSLALTGSTTFYSALKHIEFNTGTSPYTTARGFFIGARVNNSEVSYYFNQDLVRRITKSNDTDTAAGTMLIRGHRNGSYSSSKTYSFISIGDGLTDTEAANLYTAVQKYQTTLGRQV